MHPFSTLLISFWKYAGACASLNGTLLNWYLPKDDRMNADFWCLVSSFRLAVKILLLWSPVFGTVYHLICPLCHIMIMCPGVWRDSLSSCCHFFAVLFPSCGVRWLSVCMAGIMRWFDFLARCWQKPGWSGAARGILSDLFLVLGLSGSGIQGT